MYLHIYAQWKIVTCLKQLLLTMTAATGQGQPALIVNRSCLRHFLEAAIKVYP